MLLGTNIQAAYTTVSDMGINVFGLNCSTGPAEMTPSVRWLDEQDELPILVVPNAGMPLNESGLAIYKMTPTEMTEKLKEFIESYKHVRIIGRLLRKIIRNILRRCVECWIHTKILKPEGNTTTNHILRC